jgi:osmotically-inducible protein OsmY
MNDEIYTNFDRLRDGSLRLRKDFRGRGPRHIHRSEKRLYEDVCETLRSDPDVDAEEIEVKVQGDIVILGGTVETKILKRLAEEVVMAVPGVEDVQNNIKVLPRDQDLRRIGHSLS